MSIFQGITVENPFGGVVRSKCLQVTYNVLKHNVTRTHVIWFSFFLGIEASGYCWRGSYLAPSSPFPDLSFIIIQGYFYETQIASQYLCVKTIDNYFSPCFLQHGIQFLKWMKTLNLSLACFTVHHSFPAVPIVYLRCSSHTKPPTILGYSTLSLMSFYLCRVCFSLEYFLQPSNLANC